MDRRHTDRQPRMPRLTLRDHRRVRNKDDDRKPDRPDRDRGPKRQAGKDKDKDKGKGMDNDNVQTQTQTHDVHAGNTPREVPVPTPQAGGKVEAFLACLRQSLGGEYCTPAREPDCTDCSGLVRRCYRQATGRDITGDSHEQVKLGTPVSRADVQPGDLLFWDTMGGAEIRGGNPVSHVGVASGANRMINALTWGMGIRESDLGSDYWTQEVTFHGARRLEF